MGAAAFRTPRRRGHERRAAVRVLVVMHDHPFTGPSGVSVYLQRMQRFIDNPLLVESLSARTGPPVSLVRHVDALVEIYRSAIEKGRRDAWSLASA